MNGRLRVFVCLSLALALMAVGPVRAQTVSYEDALSTYERADYEVARRQFRQLAQRGHSGAETMLGVMYYRGEGVEKNNGYAAAWFYKASRRGNPSAQLALGAMHMSGQGVPADMEAAYKWLSLAAQHGSPEVVQKAEQLLQNVAATLDSDARESVQSDIRAWKADPRIDR